MSENLLAKYYQENEERLNKKARDRYQNLSKEEKEKKQQYVREFHKNLRDDKKQKLAEYGKNFVECGKMTYYNYKKLLF